MGGPIAPKCRTCRAEIRFVKLASGKAMPTGLPVGPSGTIAARWDGHGFVEGRVLAHGEAAPLGWKTFRPHWADCEKAGRRPAPTPTAKAPKPRPPVLF